MLRFALVSALALSAAPAIGGDQRLYPHTHNPNYVGSFSVPINFRPQGQNYTVRTQAYDESDKKLTRRRLPGKDATATGVAVVEIFHNR